jgi:hypothetical protein
VAAATARDTWQGGGMITGASRHPRAGKLPPRRRECLRHGLPHFPTVGLRLSLEDDESAGRRPDPAGALSRLPALWPKGQERGTAGGAVE